MLIRDIIASVPDPEPPTLPPNDVGVVEVNEQDPEYQQALVDAFNRRDALLMDFVLMMATETDEMKWPMPPGVPSPASDEWLAVAEHIGYIFDPRHLTRYLAWLKLVAIRSIEDSTRLSIAITRLNGTLEEDVAAFVAAFPGDVAR